MPLEHDPVNIFEYEALAREKLEQGHYDFIAGAATDEITLRRTRAVLDSINLRPKMLTDISQRDLSTTVLGQRISFPVMLDPAGNHEAAHPDAELATARAAGKAGTIMVVSSHAARRLEDVAEAASGPLWFQQYLFSDRGLTLEMAARAAEAGYSALCITVDAKIKPKRERNIRNDYVGAPSPNYDNIELPQSSWRFAADAPAGPMDIRDSGATWADIDWPPPRACPWSSRASWSARTDATPPTMAQRPSSSPITAPATSTPLSPPSKSCPKSSRPPTTTSRSTWTAASAAAPTS